MRGLEIVLFLGTNLSLLILRDQNPTCWIHWVFAFSGQVERGWMIELLYNLLFWFIQPVVIQIPFSLTIIRNKVLPLFSVHSGLGNCIDHSFNKRQAFICLKKKRRLVYGSVEKQKKQCCRGRSWRNDLALKWKKKVRWWWKHLWWWEQ